MSERERERERERQSQTLLARDRDIWMGSKYNKECGPCMVCALLLWWTDTRMVNKMHASMLSPEVHVVPYTHHSGKWPHVPTAT